MRYKLIIAYDGTDYHGWQVQPDEITVAGTLQNRFYNAFKIACQLIGASRTDAGVHALGQVAECRTEFDLDPEKLRLAWNNILPADIVIRSLEQAEESFKIFRQVDYKIYHYHFFLERPLPFFQRYGWYYWHPVNLDYLHNALQVFVGTHDFRSFCTGDEKENTVRTIRSITVEYVSAYNCYRIVVIGPSFLRYMIRRVVGASLEVASRIDLSMEVLHKALEQKDPRQLLPTAHAKGLLLYKIVYKQ